MVQAIKEASEYPFRAEAVKSIVAVLASPCEKSVFPVSVSILFTELKLELFHH